MFEKFTAAAVAAVSHLHEALHQVTEQSVVPNLSYPGDQCCSVYADPNWSGTVGTFCLGTADEFDHWDMRDYNLNDIMTSWYCGRNVSYRFCYDPYGDECGSHHGEQGAGTAKNSRSGRDDRLTNLELSSYDVTKAGALILYDDPNCTGVTGSVLSPVDPTIRQCYTQSELEMNNVDNDRPSSFRIPYGYSAFLYSGPACEGDYYAVSGRPYDDATYEPDCQDLNSVYNDRISSVEIFKDSILGAAKGYWRGLTTTESVTFTVHYGFSTSSTEATSVNQQYELSMEMSESFEFMGLTESYTMSESYSASIQHDTEQTYSYDMSVDIVLQCSEQEAGNGVGLWQFVSESHSGQATVFTQHTVCRYGSEYNTAPACPWNACLDGSCSTCKTDWMA